MSFFTRSSGRHHKVGYATAAVAALIVSACGSSATKSAATTAAPATTAAATATTAAAATTAAPKAAAGIEAAKQQLAALSGPVKWPAVKPLSKKPDIAGKTVYIVPIGDAVPVLHGISTGISEALTAAGAKGVICDGKFDPTAISGCLKTAGDEKASAVVTLFVDYAMIPAAFDALASSGTAVLLGGVGPTGGRQADKNLSFFTNSARVNKLYEAMSASAAAIGGDTGNALWLKLLDSSTTKGASEAGVAKYGELCPKCGLATVDFTTANIDQLSSAVSAALVANPKTNLVVVPVDSFVPPVLGGIQSAGFGSKVKLISSSSDVAGLQRVKDGQQAADLGTPVLHTGWIFANALMQLLAGDPVEPETELVTRNFTADNVGSLKLTPEAYLSPEWFGDDSYKAAFLSAWKLK